MTFHFSILLIISLALFEVNCLLGDDEWTNTMKKHLCDACKVEQDFIDFSKEVSILLISTFS